MIYLMKGNPLLKFLAAVAGVDPTMPGTLDEDTPPTTKADDSRIKLIAKGPFAGRRRAPDRAIAASSRRSRAR
jgi:hypothetical protein